MDAGSALLPVVRRYRRGDIADLLKDPAQSLDAAFCLGVAQEVVTRAADSSHSAVSRLEQGTRTPQLPTLQRIAAVLNEELLVCFRRTVDGEVEREFAAVA